MQKVGAEELVLTVLRDGQPLQLRGHAQYQASENRYVVGFVQSWDKYSILGSVSYGLAETYTFTKTILVSLVEMVTGKIPVDISGPVGMVSAVESVSSYGFANILVFTAILSINLGIINLLPFPALDGSRIVFSLLHLVRGKPLDQAKENAVHFVGLMLLFGLMILITYKRYRETFFLNVTRPNVLFEPFWWLPPAAVGRHALRIWLGTGLRPGCFKAEWLLRVRGGRI